MLNDFVLPKNPKSKKNFPRFLQIEKVPTSFRLVVSFRATSYLRPKPHSKIGLQMFFQTIVTYLVWEESSFQIKFQVALSKSLTRVTNHTYIGME